MQRVIAASSGGVDLLTAPRTIMDFDLPPARLNDFGRAAQLAGANPYEGHYDDAAFTIQVKVEPCTRADVETLVAGFRPGAGLSWTDTTGSGTSYVRTAEVAADEDHGTFRLVTMSGTRSAAWETATQTFSGTVTGGWGTYDLPSVGGELAAKMSLTLTCASAWTLAACGLKADPATGYDPTDAAITAQALTQNADTAIGTAATFDVAANRGQHMVVAKSTHTATASALKYQVGSDILTNTVWEPRVAAAASPMTAALGMVKVPSYDLPPNTAGAAYKAATGISQTTTGAVVTTPLNSGNRLVYQTFTLSARRRVASVSVKVTNAAATDKQVSITIRSLSGGGTPNTTGVGGFPGGAVMAPPGTSVVTAIFPTDIVRDAGEYSFVASAPSDVTFWRDAAAPYAGGVGGHMTSAGVFTAGDGTDATIDWYFTVALQEELTFNAATPVRARCTETGKTATVDALARIPADDGWFVVTGSFGAGTGVYVDPGLQTIYPVGSAGVTGIALTATTTMPVLPQPIPNVANRLVIAGGTGNVTVSGTITERRINRG